MHLSAIGRNNRLLSRNLDNFVLDKGLGDDKIITAIGNFALSSENRSAFEEIRSTRGSGRSGWKTIASMNQPRMDGSAMNDRGPGDAGKKPVLGFLTYEGADNWISAIWYGVVDAAKKYGANLISFSSRQLWDSPDRLSDNLSIYDQINARVDGLISTDLAAPWIVERLKPFLSKPSVLLNFISEDFTSISVDYFGGMKSAAEHFIRHHGFRKIAFIRGPVQSDTEARYKAYLEALQENGIALDSSLVSKPCASQGYGDGFDAMNKLLAQGERRFEAVLASNDDIAIEAIGALAARKIRVP